MPASHDSVAASMPDREAEDARVIGHLKSQLGKLQGGWDAKCREVQLANGARSAAQRKQAELQHALNCAETELAQVRTELAHPIPQQASAHPPAPTPTPTPAPAPNPAPAPKLRKCDTHASRAQAVKKLRMLLQLYPAESQADLVARAVVLDRRGREVGLSPSLAKDLLRSPRMAVTMQQYAEELLTRAREHMMSHVFSASSFVAASRLLRLSGRKLCRRMRRRGFDVK